MLKPDRSDVPSPPPSPRPRRIAGLVAVQLAALLSLVGVISLGLPRAASAQSLGQGSYTTTLPAGADLPTGCGDLSTDPRSQTTANAPAGAIPTNDWWSSILFKKTNCAFGEPMMAHPASYAASAGGLGISYTTTPVITGSATGVSEYHFPYTRDVLVGVPGLNAGSVKVDGWSDWTVSPIWTDGTRTLRATIGHGLPMSYYTVKGGGAQLTTDGPPAVWSNSGATIGFSIRGHDYVAYAPSGSTWSVNGSTISSGLNGKNFFTVAVLPTTSADSDSDRTALATSYGRYAFAAVNGTRVSYSYDETTSKVRTTYGFTTRALQGSETRTVASLYPHEWQHLSGGSPISRSYVSPRGAMKTLVGISSFSTVMTFHGVLPEVPAVADSGGADLATLKGYLAQVADDPEAQQKADTYWTGKGLGRAARIAEIADQVGETGTRDKALAAIRSTLTDWFTASPGKTGQVFYYDKNWGTLIGYPASYGSDQELNDHHFHYGYYIASAATLAKFDPAWAKTSAYGGMVDLLIRDANNYDRSDTRFPYLRDFDIYAGHDWASGHGSFAAGNNQESSSEGLNFAGALIQWGEATGNKAVRDAGIYIYTTESAAIDDYWFDTDQQTFPKSFGHNTVGMVWGDGAAYATWFSSTPEEITGINHLPITGNHLYLGADPAYVVANYDQMEKLIGGPPTKWQDIAWEYLALGDGPRALAKFRANPGFTSEEGESKAHTFHWIDNLAALGTVDSGVTAGHPLAAVFTRNGARTYVAANITASPLTVRFSDGTSVAVPAGKTVAKGARTWSGGSATGGLGVGSGSGGSTPPPTTAPPTTAPPTTAPPTTAPPTTAPPTTAPPTTAPPTTAPPTSAPPTSAPPTSAPPTSGGCGSPCRLYLRAGGGLGASGGAGTVTVPASTGIADNQPHNPVTFTATGLTGRWTGGATAFDLAVDSGAAVGNGVQVRVSVDLTGDGRWDRVETYHYYATDPVPGWEHATAATTGLVGSTGRWGHLAGGRVKVEVWNAIGSAPASVGVGNTSTLTLPLGG
ncbi:endoglucanase Acf2 [Friedmanniella endophytica]|uniref:glucan endo-1,3-beta-D-glucosidase n=1 Tax=Microlunatus kandeliicorticis TaxID=1759536 RepID=A0A7W3IQ65_9ACTN|nr:glycosyl hydrolase [Microlunatus kandeliicorticis]MBA8793145.1 endoglucanase Acf2 [Microlunatus kandeliicorticis]